MTESTDGAKPEVRGGVPLPKVTSDAASELFSPDPAESSDAVAVPPDGDPHASTMVGPVASRSMPEAPRHARRSRPKAGFVAAAGAALVAIPLVVLATLGGGDDPHGSSAQNPPSGAAGPGVPAPGGPGASLSATPTPGDTSGTQAAAPDKPAKQPNAGSSGGGDTTGGGTAGGGTSSGGTSGGGTAGGGTSGGATSAPAGPPAGGWSGGAGRPGPGGGRWGGGPRGPGMGGGFR
jgi:hypothetical protein